jgi:hypothetical protein
VAHTKLLNTRGRFAFEPRRYFACNLRDYRGPYDILCMSFDPEHMDREAWTFAAVVNEDPAVRAVSPALFKLCSGRRRLQVFVLRTKRWPVSRIASQLGISEAVVNEHMTEAYRLLGFDDDRLERASALVQSLGLRDGPCYDGSQQTR